MRLSTMIAATASVATASIVGGRACRAPVQREFDLIDLTSSRESPVVESPCWRRRARDTRRLAALPHTFTLCHTPLLFLERS